MVEVLQLHHVAINVTDLERSREFYKSIVRLKEIESPNFSFDVAWFDIGGRQLHLMLVPDSKTFRGTTEVSPVLKRLEMVVLPFGLRVIIKHLRL